MPELMKDVREKLNMLGEVNTCAVMSNWFALAFAGKFLDTYQLGCLKCFDAALDS